MIEFSIGFIAGCIFCFVSLYLLSLYVDEKEYKRMMKHGYDIRHP